MMRRFIIFFPLLLVISLGSSNRNYLLAQDSPISKIETTWKRIKCPFDSSNALLPVTCGRLIVPENYNEPNGRMIEIAFMMVKAKKNRDPEHPVLFLNGGPGQ